MIIYDKPRQTNRPEVLEKFCYLYLLWARSVGANRFYTLETFWITKHLLMSILVAIGTYVKLALRPSPTLQVACCFKILVRIHPPCHSEV